MITLSPCPFCGGDEFEINEEADFDHPDTTYKVVHCMGCCADGPIGLDDEQAAKYWNGRKAK